MQREWREHWVGGEWISPSDHADLLPVINPATEQPAGFVPAASPEDAARALEAARRALTPWRSSEPAQRARILRAVAGGIRANAGSLAAAVTAEVGTPVSLCRSLQVDLAAVFFENAADIAESLDFEYVEGKSRILLEPAGVVAAIVPWNFPLHQAATKLAYALAAGCTVVVKASPDAPLALFELGRIMEAAGLTSGVVSMIAGDGPTTGEAMVCAEATDFVSFTGSTNAGRRVASLAAERVTPLALELGGKSASILLDDLTAEGYAKAVRRTVSDCMLNAGQRCIALSRMLVPRHRLAEAEDVAATALQRWRFGDPCDEGTTVGPLISASARDRVTDMIGRAVNAGAKALAHGPGIIGEHGFFVAPTVLSEVPPDAAVAQEEIFGPVLVIMPYEDEDDAITLANSTRYGLSGAVWGNSDEDASRVARELDTGQVAINGGVFDHAAPFGGRKQSGYGRECGPAGVHEFLVTKALLS